MKTLVLANHKGGVGKSAVATMLSHYFVKRGQRVLVVDLDQQGNCSTTLGLCTRVVLAGITSNKVLEDPHVSVPAKPFVLVPAGDDLLWLERQPERHNAFAGNFRAFLGRVADDFDVCVVDTNPNPDIRLVTALVSTDFVLSPLQMKQEAVDGIHQLLSQPRVGVLRIKQELNKEMQFIGLLPTLVESTPFQRENASQVYRAYGHLMIKMGEGNSKWARIPNRSVIAEAQASGQMIWEIKKTAARDAWREIEPVMAHIADLVLGLNERHGDPH